MKKTFALFGICSLIALFSCTVPSGNFITEHFPLDGSYYSLYVSDGMIVNISEDVDDIVITADEKVMEKMHVEHRNGRLRIFRNDVSVAYPTKTTVTLPYDPALKQIEVHMDSEFHTDFTIEGENVKVKLDGDSKFYGYVFADNLDLIVNDGSEAICSYDVYDLMYVKLTNEGYADLDGYAGAVNLVMEDNSEIEPSWNGDYYAFSCGQCYGTMTNNCKAYLDCESNIAMTLTNSSFLYYTGLPDLSESLIDDSSDFIYSGGDKK